jgi:hypothetical protein
VKDVRVTGLAVKNRNQELVLAVQKLMKISANVLKLGYGLSNKENIEIIDI